MSGDCFMVAGRLQASDHDLVLVHGTVLAQVEGGTAKVGQRHWHAWVERTSTHSHPDFPGMSFVIVDCIDKANGNDVTLPLAMYYKVGRVEDVRKYTRDEAAVLMLQYRHWGPWDNEHPPNTPADWGKETST